MNEKKMKNSSRKTGQYLFMAILTLHALLCYFMGFSTLFNPSFSVKSGFNIDYTSDMKVLALVIGMELLFLGSIAILGIIWTKRKSFYGIYAGAAVGLYMLAFGIIAFLKFGTTEALMIDSIRGLLTLIFAFIAFKELKKQIK